MSSSSLSGYNRELPSGLVGPGGAGATTSTQHQSPSVAPTAIGAGSSGSSNLSGSITGPSMLDFTRVGSPWCCYNNRSMVLSLSIFLLIRIS